MSKFPIPLSRAWNSWESDHPAAMCYLPLGLEIRPCAYAASRNAFTDFPAGAPGLKLGPRSITAEDVQLGLSHAGTELELRYERPEQGVLLGSYRARKNGEWGLRFWVLLVLRLMPPERAGSPLPWRFDESNGVATAAHDGKHIAVRASRRPLLVTVHPSLDALHEEMEEKGYWYLESRGTAGPVMALRFNLEEMPELSFATAVAEDMESATEYVRVALSRVPPSPPSPSRGEGVVVVPSISPSPLMGEGWGGGEAKYQSADALAAVRDVIAWNTVWDPVNRRPYTTLSRNWGTQKFGGWGVWLDDLFFHALMASLVDADVARENLEAALSNATPYGNLACLVTGRDAWVDRSQPPVGSLVTWLLYQRLGDETLLRDGYPVLAANHAWWLKTRDGNGDGLYEYGSSDVGSGLYAGTKLAAKDESFMDNSPVHDETRFDETTRTLDSADVGLNSLIALDAEILSLIAGRLDDAGAAERYSRTAEALRARITERLWDEERQVFANRLWSGKFVRSLAPTSFFPLLAGAANAEQASAMVGHLKNPVNFGGAWLLPSVTRDDPAFLDNVYWRGRIWPPLNFLVWMGLRRVGYLSEATDLAENGWTLFQRAWKDRRCPENFSAATGDAFDQPDTDDFYGWGALMPFIALGERIDVSPWQGWTLARGIAGESIGPIRSPWGALTVSFDTDSTTVMVDWGFRLRTSVGRLTGLNFADGCTHAGLPAGSGGDWVELPQENVRSASLDGNALHGRDEGGRIRFTLSSRATPMTAEFRR